MTHRFHRKQNRLLLLRLSNKNKVRKSTGAHRQQVTRRHLHQSPCGRPAGSGCARPPSRPYLLLPPFRVPGGGGVLRSPLSRARALRPFLSGTGRSPARLQPTAPSLPPPLGPRTPLQGDVASLAAACRPRAHGARLAAEAALSQTRPPVGSRLDDQPFRHSLALWGHQPPGLPTPPGAALCLTISRPSRHPDTAGRPSALIWAHCPRHAPRFLWRMSSSTS